MPFSDLPPPSALSHPESLTEEEAEDLQAQLSQMDLGEPEFVTEAARRADEGLGERGVAEGIAGKLEGMELGEPEWLKGG